jgi:hypothetical protein
MIVTSCNVLAVGSLTAALWLIAVMLACFVGTLALVGRVFGF